MTAADTLLSFAGVTKRFEVGPRRLTGQRDAVVAVRDLNLSVAAGEIVGLVGQSGAGKTTVGRLALGLERPDEGQVTFDGVALQDRSARALRALRHRMHMVFQDPYQSLHPGMRVGQAVAEPLEIAGTGRRQRREAVLQALEEVKLTPGEEYIDRYPHQLSGGQRQRVAFARALVANPRLVVADEPTSMLDVSLRAGILELVLHIRQRARSAVLYITHDLAVAKHICDRIGVMQQGRLVEVGPAAEIIDHPTHDYTRRLLRAAENLGHAWRPGAGTPPRSARPGSGATAGQDR